MSDEEIVQPDAIAETPETDEAVSPEPEEIAATPEQTEDEERPKRRSRAEERINALTKEKYDAQKRAEAAEQRMTQIEQYFQQQQAPVDLSMMPKLSDFDYDENRYNQAIAQWHAGQRQSWEQEQQERQQQAALHQQELQRQAALQAKVAAGVEKYPDFMQKVFDPNLPRLADVSPAAFEAVLDSDQAPEVAYYLANNPQEVYGFASLTPIQAIRKVAQIEAKFGEKRKPNVPPPPPSRVSGNSEAVQDPQKMSTSEWMEWRNRQISKR